MAIAESTTSDESHETEATIGAPPDTRTRLIDAAIEVFLENGYAKSRVQDIARRAGLTTGAMYAHFTNKAALLSEAIATRGDLAMNALVDEIGGSAYGHTPALAVGVRALSGPSQPVDRLMLEALAVSARDGETDDLIGPALQRMRQILRDRVDAASEAGTLDSSLDADALVSVFQRLVLGSIVAKAIDLPSADPDQSERVMTALLTTVTPGIPPGN